MHTEFITPEQAKHYLSLNDPDNRPMDLRKVTKYIASMEAGEWELRDSLGFSYYDGYLINGQHRMLALSKANVVGEWFNVEKNG